MRANFERFGGYISLDTMKRAINKWLWPYMSIVMYNELRKLCLGCEAIVCGEREDAYRFMIGFLIKNSPGKPSSDVHAVAGDGFFNQEMIVRFGFVNARFIADWHHLFATGLSDHFGKHYSDLLNTELRQMIVSKSETYFNTALGNARQKLSQRTRRNLEIEKKLDEFAAAKVTYAQFEIDKIKGTRGFTAPRCH